MATTDEARPQLVPGLRPERQSLGRTVISWVTSTDHKVIGYLYLITAFLFFLIGGVLAMAMRLELFDPGMTLFQSKEQYNQFFTMHGTIMLFLFATPLFTGFGNVFVPLQIGAPDVAFPRLNMFSYWLFLFGGLIALAGFLTPRVRRASAGRPTPRCRSKPSHRDSAATCGSWASA
jgi:cytochrome c oxidase subunit 1